MTFANYFRELTGWDANPSLIAVATLGVLTLVNCLGVRAGSNVQSTLMVLKIAAIVMLVVLVAGTQWYQHRQIAGRRNGLQGFV